MEPFPPFPPRTIIVVDDYPSEVSSFLCAVLDAHALPYTVHGRDPAPPTFDYRAPLEPRRASTLIRLDGPQPRRAGQGLRHRLTALGLAVMPLPGGRRWTQRHPTARSRPPRRLQWPHALAWGAGLGLVVSLVVGAPWVWRAGWLPHVPSSPPPRSAHTAAVPGGPPAAEARPSAQSQTPTAPGHLTGTAPGGTAASEPRSHASVARPAASLRPQASAPPHASTRPRAVERARVGGAPRPRGWSAALPAPQAPWWRGAPDPARESERPWNRGLVNDTGE